MASICPNCANPLTFSPDHKALFCNKCGGVFSPESIETEHRDLLEGQEILSRDEIYGTAAQEAAPEGAQGAYGSAAGTPEDMGDFNIYTCNSCGGEIVINDTEASTYCIYCGSPSIVFSRVSKFKKPKYIMPFKISRQQAEEKIRKTIAKNLYIPKEIKKLKVDTIRGIYIPYQIVDVEYRDALFLQATVGSGKSRRTVYYKRAGTALFNNVPIEASSKLSDGSSIKLEPYDLSDLVSFDEDYLTGFYSDMCDIDKTTLDITVKKRLYDIFLSEVKKECHGTVNKVMYSHPYLNYQKAPDYAMLPVWFLTFFYENKPHTILVNGQTGKVVCGLPWVKNRVVAHIAAIGTFLSPIIGYISYQILQGADDLDGRTFVAIFIICATLFGIGYGKFNEVKKAISETQSNATFGFVKKRQG